MPTENKPEPAAPEATEPACPKCHNKSLLFDCDTAGLFIECIHPDCGEYFARPAAQPDSTALDADGGWIRVSERMPEIVEEYGPRNCYGQSSKILFIGEAGDCYLGYLYKSGAWAFESGEVASDKITHWRELPKPPKAKP